MICHPRASYEVHHPDEIFLHDVYSKIVDHSPRYKGSFLKIDVLSLYNEVLSLCSQRSRHLYKLDSLVRKAAKMKAKLENHPSVEVPNESKSKAASEQTGKLEEGNSVLGSVMGELDATSTLLKDKESEVVTRHDSVRLLEDDATTRLIDVTIDPEEKEAPDLTLVMKEENENDGLLAKLNHLEALALEVRKTGEEANKVVQLIHKLVDVLMEKVNENGVLLEKVNHLEAQLLIAKKASEEAKAETPVNWRINH
ncbi:uncharacterized protein LOC119301438 [Triticum dicoccoides]|uniref:uncharacterized protein LOC119301438 n=1 Tax=Triticum dicoccoides TaxID=85692 RepID=UPI00188F048A|nr:uncharacterized protein LOC119301438 [Triticum dicoccoides]